MDDWSAGDCIVIYYGDVAVEYTLVQQEAVVRDPGGVKTPRFHHYWIPFRMDYSCLTPEQMNNMLKQNRAVVTKRGGGFIPKYNTLPKYAHVGKLMPE